MRQESRGHKAGRGVVCVLQLGGVGGVIESEQVVLWTSLQPVQGSFAFASRGFTEQFLQSLRLRYLSQPVTQCVVLPTEVSLYQVADGGRIRA